MKTFPLAVYTAGHGLDWTYPEAEIPFAALDACRKAFGSLPDFDAGENGFEGVWATADRVFILKCQSVRAWDFRGRDATYLSVTWVSRAEAPEIDFDRLLSADAMRVPTRTPPAFFEIDATKAHTAQPSPDPGRGLVDFSCAGDVIANAPPADDVLLKRSDDAPGVSCVIRPRRDQNPRIDRERERAPVRRQEACDLSEMRGELERPRSPTATCLVALILLWIATAAAGGFVCMKLHQANRRCEVLRHEVERLERRLLENQMPCPNPLSLFPWTQDDWGCPVFR